jgi:phospholipase C
VTRSPAVLSLVFAAAVLPMLGPAAAAGAARSPSTVPSPSSAIRHVVVMTQGGRSFDNYFGARSGVDGIPTGSCQLASRISQARCMAPHALTPASVQSPLLTTAAVQVASVNRGAMNGFVRAQTSKRTDGTAANAYYRRGSLPLLDDVAKRGVLFDHWFSGVPGGTVANRLFAVTAQPAGDPLAVPTDGWPAVATIFDRLTAAGVPWRVYVQNYEPALTIDTASTKQRLGGQVARVPLLAMRGHLDDPALASHVVDLDRYYSDLATGRLPAVSWIVSTSATEQAPQDPTRGQQLTRAVVNALFMSKEWAHSAFFLNYDSSGGWFDHVQPPRMSGATVGLRVPAMLLSPYVVPGTVDHATFDASSTLKLIEQLWGLSPLAERDRDARSPLAAFDFRRQPQQATLLAVAGERPVSQPDRTVLYLGYLAAACVVAALWASVHRSGTRRARPLPAGAS